MDNLENLCYNDYMAENKRGNTDFVRQAAILAAAGVFARFLGFLYRLPMSNLIGYDGDAIYGVSFNIYTFLLILSSAGLPAAIAKMVSERRAAGDAAAAHRVFKVAFVLSGSIGLVFMAVVYIFAADITAFFIEGVPEAALALRMLTPTVFIVAMMAVIRGYFQGMSTTVPTALSQLVEQIFNAVFSVVLAYTMWDFALNRGYYAEGYGAAGGTLGSTVGALAGFAVIVGLYFLFRKDILRQVRLSIRRAEPSIPAKKGIKTEKTSVLVRTILATSFTIIAGTAIFSIVNLIDGRLVQQRLLVAGFEIGRARELYGQVLGRFNPISNLPAAISSSLAIAMIPAIAAASRRGQRLEVRNKANTGLRVGMFLTMPIAFGLAVLGSQITALLFPGFPEGGTLFIVGFPSIIFLAASQIATGALQAIGKTIIPVYAALAGALAKIVSSYMLIAQPNINIYGAVIGTSVCYLVTAIINCLFLHRHTGAASDIIGIIIKPAFASAGMAAGVFTFYHSVYILSGSNAFAVAFAVLGGIVLYSVFLLLANVLKDEDILFLPKGNKILTLLKNKGLL